MIQSSFCLQEVLGSVSRFYIEWSLSAWRLLQRLTTHSLGGQCTWFPFKILARSALPHGTLYSCRRHREVHGGAYIWFTQEAVTTKYGCHWCLHTNRAHHLTNSGEQCVWRTHVSNDVRAHRNVSFVCALVCPCGDAWESHPISKLFLRLCLLLFIIPHLDKPVGEV